MTDSTPVYVVAGAGSGLGAALIGTLGPSGATIVAIARRQSHLAGMEKVARAQSWSLRSVTADLKVQRDVDSAMSGVLRELGHIDGVAVNAGRWIPGSSLIHEIGDAEWEDGITSNLNPLLTISRAVLPSMIKERRGSLVLVAAAEAVRWAGAASYSAAKGAVLDLGRKMAHDYRTFGIRVNVVLPGNMVAHVDPANPPRPETHVALQNDTPTSPWEVARVIAFLLTAQGRWVTGATFTVDGGRSTWAPEQG